MLSIGQKISNHYIGHMNFLLLIGALLLLALSFWLQRRPFLVTTQREHDERSTLALLSIIPGMTALFAIQDVFIEAYPQLNEWWVLLGIAVISILAHALYVWPARKRAAKAGINTSFSF